MAMKKSKKKIVTPAEYAKLRDISPSAVNKQIRRKRPLPHVEEIQEFSRFYLLVLEDSVVSKGK